MDKDMSITVEFSDAGLWGDVNPEVEGYDTEASVKAFVAEMESALHSEFPEAETKAKHGINDFVHVVTEDYVVRNAVELRVLELIEQVWGQAPWEVEIGE